MLKKFSPIKKKARQKMPSFFSRAQTYHSFSFNLQLLYFLSKIVCGILRFDLVSFLLKFVFFSIKCMKHLTLKRHNSLQY